MYTVNCQQCPSSSIVVRASVPLCGVWACCASKETTTILNKRLQGIISPHPPCWDRVSPGLTRHRHISVNKHEISLAPIRPRILWFGLKGTDPSTGVLPVWMHILDLGQPHFTKLLWSALNMTSSPWAGGQVWCVSAGADGAWIVLLIIFCLLLLSILCWDTFFCLLVQHMS